MTAANNRNSGNADRIEAEAATWIARQDRAPLNRHEAEELERWLDETILHRVAWLRLKAAWDSMGRIAALRTSDPRAEDRRQHVSSDPGVDRFDQSDACEEQEGVAARGPYGFRRYIRLPLIGAVAACLLALAGGPFLYLRMSNGPEALPETYVTAIGGYQTVPLVDGSRVELNTNTELRADIHRDRRHIWLARGEAYFEVAHDSAHPFVVDAGSRRITVLGTRFSVRRDGDRILVAVVDGKVRVEPVGPDKADTTRIIGRGDLMIASSAEGATLVRREDVTAVENALTWREGVLSFDHTALADAVVEFNRYNRRQMVITDPATAAIRIEGSFNATNGEAFARLLRSAFGLKVSMGEEHIIISD